MATFKGTNKTKSARLLLHRRAKYKLNSFPINSGMGPKQINDFNFAELTMYGKIDTYGDPVILDSQYLKGSKYATGPSTVVLADFVTDMFNDFQNYFITACRIRTIYLEDPYLSIINPVRGYSSPKRHYNEYIFEMTTIFNEIYIKDRNLLKDILTFQDYVNHFIKFAERLGEGFPMTFTGWHRSQNSSIFNSGIAVDIAGLDAGDDSQKERFFLNSPNYEFYLNVALQTGFSVTKNAPWILVADLASPATKVYLKKYFLSTPNQIFSEKYNKVYEFEIDLLKNILIQGYNEFVSDNPFYKKLILCNNKTSSNIIYRNNININTLNNKFTNKQWLKFYTVIRNIEERKPYREPDLQRIIKNAIFYEKELDMISAVGYINEQYRSIYITKKGGLNDIIVKQRKKKLRKRFGEASEDVISGMTPKGGSSGGISGY